MNAADLPALLTTFGPMGVVVWWVVKTQLAFKPSDAADPIMTKLEAIQKSTTDIDKRLAVVETILEERKK